MPQTSIFDGGDAIIARALDLKPGEALKHKSVCRRLSGLDRPPPSMAGMVADLYAQIASNRTAREPSSQNWRLERQTAIGAGNASPEVLLERAIAIVAERGLLDGWYNQIPVASGLVDDRSDKRAAIDLLRFHGNEADLIELKWGGDTPAFAAFEILGYGLAYLYAVTNKRELGYANKRLLACERVILSVLAPDAYYDGCKLDWLERALDGQLRAFAPGPRQNAVSLQFRFLAFPRQFRLPFQNGADVESFELAPADDPAIRSVLEAIETIKPVWSAP